MVFQRQNEQGHKQETFKTTQQHHLPFADGAPVSRKFHRETILEAFAQLLRPD